MTLQDFKKFYYPEIKIDFTENWVKNNPIVNKGAICINVNYIQNEDKATPFYIKIGDGKNSWNSLEYIQIDDINEID